MSLTTHLYRKIGLKTITLYDKPDNNFPMISSNYGITGQKYLVNRISSITRIPDSEWEGTHFGQKDRVTSYYSYDPHGNVDWYYQEVLPGKFSMPGMGTLASYEYDLLSGNVHEIHYQQKQPEEFTQYFEYDADNRIIDVSTSRHGILREGDSKYQYYPHGPLQRRSVGTDSLQGLDYYYTIHGWLKGINTVSNLPFDQIGRDGFITGVRKVVGKDIFSMNLNYYEDDYSSNAPGGSPFWNESDPPDNNLYDGNISSWNNKFNRVAYPVADSIDPVLDNYHAQYEYDLAGRLVQSRLDTLSGSTRNSQDKFKTDYFYDLNGNMDTLTRWDNLAMPNGISNLRGTAPITNKPNNRQVFSVQSSPSGGVTTFAYDNMGNLVSELNPMVESMNLIRWTADGKLAVTMKNINVTDSITHAVHQLSLYQHYYYDGMGNRVLKIGNGKLDPQEEGMDPILLHCNMHIDGTGCAPCQEDLNVRGYYYAREAGGKVLATYETSPEGVTGMGSSCYAAYYYLDLKEWYIYGSESDGRISVLKPYTNEFNNIHLVANHIPQQALAEPLAMKDTIIYYGFDNIGTYQTNARYTGHKEYEIKDHLGNVRAVISDVKNPESMIPSISSWTFTAEIRNLNNYYPYGMELPGGAYATIGNYGYGYNGMERVEVEAKNTGSKKYCRLL